MQTQSGRPRRVKRRRMSDRGGKIARLAWAEVLASISATGSARKAFGDERGPYETPRGENPSRQTLRSSETSDRVCAQRDRWKPLPGAEFVHFSRVNGESVLGRTYPHFRRSERSGNAQGRRQKRQRLARFKDERRTQTSRSSAESKIASLVEDNADEEKRVESPKRVERRENAPCTECTNQ